MAVMVRTCCCGCDLKTGILLIALYGLVSKSEYPCQYNTFGVFGSGSSATTAWPATASVGLRLAIYTTET